MSGQIKVVQKKSLITEPKSIRRIMESLGLGKLGTEKIFKDNNCIRGQVNKVKHLVRYELV